MNTPKHHRANVLVTGVIVTLLVSLVLFWARWLVSVSRDSHLFPSARRVDVAWPSIPELETQGQSGETTPFVTQAQISQNHPYLTGLGILQCLEARWPGGPGSPIYRWDPDHPGGSRCYYDSALGQIVYEGTETVQRPDGTSALRPFAYYAGPEGMAKAPDEKLGRFGGPISDGIVSQPQIVYDRVARRFFAIDWSRQMVRKGPELPNDGVHEPVQIRFLHEAFFGDLLVAGPAPRTESRPNQRFLPAYYLLTDRVPVLDASGRIDLLDLQSLEFVATAVGRLVAPTPILGGMRPARPQDLVAYEVSPFGINSSGDGKEWSYGGCAVATLGREGLGLQVDVYDAKGNRVAGNETRVPHYTETADGSRRDEKSVPSAEGAYFYLPGAKVPTLAKFTLENLHPPVFLALSYLAAPHLDARAGYRSVFLLPDSFVAMMARNTDAGPFERPSLASLFACPALFLALLLAWLVTRDGVRLGLSKNARLVWAAAAVVFGLPAYLTYRLTRQKVTLVTCSNCGLGRRPDRDKCHRCGSPWTVPELTPPTWRVIDEGSPAALGWESRITQPGAAMPNEQASSEPQ